MYRPFRVTKFERFKWWFKDITSPIRRKFNLPRKISFCQPKVFFAWYDFWVGAFWDQKKYRIYICPIPCLVFSFRMIPYWDNRCNMCQKGMARYGVCKNCAKGAGIVKSFVCDTCKENEDEDDLSIYDPVSLGIHVWFKDGSTLTECTECFINSSD